MGRQGPCRRRVARAGEQLIVLHCVSGYPDHTPGTGVSVAAWLDGSWRRRRTSIRRGALAEDLRRRSPASSGRHPRIRAGGQTSATLVLEPIFEADLQPEQYAYRPERSAHGAIKLYGRHHEVVDCDLSNYFGEIPHVAPKGVARRVGRYARAHRSPKCRWRKTTARAADAHEPGAQGGKGSGLDRQSRRWVTGACERDPQRRLARCGLAGLKLTSTRADACGARTSLWSGYRMPQGDQRMGALG